MSTELADAFLAVRTVDDGAVDRAALDAQLVALYREGNTAWPAFVLAPVAYANALAPRSVAIGELPALCAGDLYLAIASTSGDAAAITAVEDLSFGELDHAARKTGATAAQTDDVRSDLRRLLFVAEPTRAAGIATYAGRGSLAAYVRVIATRALVRVVQRGRREVELEAAVLDEAGPHVDPVLAQLGAHRETVARAVAEACAALDRDDRALLRYAIVEGWSIDRLAALYQIHRTSAWRRVGTARERLGELIRDRVAAHLAIGRDEVDSIVRALQSRVEVSLERVLAPSRD